MKKLILYLLIILFCVLFQDIFSQNIFNDYLTCYNKHVCLSDSNLIIEDGDYMTFENRWMCDFKFDFFLPKSIFKHGFVNCYFMLTVQQDEHIIVMTKATYEENGIETAEYYFVMYNNNGEILDTLCLLAGRDTYKDIKDFYMSYIMLNKNEILQICVGPYSDKDTTANCKKIIYTIKDNGFIFNSEELYNKVFIPNNVTDVRL